MVKRGEVETHHSATIIKVLFFDIFLVCLPLGYQIIIHHLLLVQGKDCTYGTLLKWTTERRYRTRKCNDR